MNNKIVIKFIKILIIYGKIVFEYFCCQYWIIDKKKVICLILFIFYGLLKFLWVFFLFLKIKENNFYFGFNFKLKNMFYFQG